MLRQPLVTKRLATGSSITADTNYDNLLPDFDSHSVTFKAKVTAMAGTSPTLDLYIQTTDDGGTTWYDCAHFTQISASAADPVWATVTVDAGDIVMHDSVGSKTLSAGTAGLPILSNLVRVVADIGGTSPSASFTVDALLPNVEFAS